MELKNRVTEIIKRLNKEYPNAKIALKFGNPVEILVATILSAQCTDARVNIVTKTLFRKYRAVRDYAGADIKKLEQDIRSTGFFHSKAKNIINSAKIIAVKFCGKVPDTMEELVMLPGVARKTANIVLGNAFGKVEGIAVDTHVRRLSQRLGLSKTDDPVKIEQGLMALVPKDEWFRFSNALIDHGRKVCGARKPECGECFLKDVCPKIGVGHVL